MNMELKFGLLTALRPTAERRNNHVVWEFRCDCGNTVYRALTSVKYSANKGITPNCGCVGKERIAERERRDAERWEKKERIAAEKMKRDAEVQAIFDYFSSLCDKKDGL